MSDPQEPQDMYDPSVPVLNDVYVPGDPRRARVAPPMSPSADGRNEPSAAVRTGSAPRADGHDADALVDRLRGRCVTWLAGEGRAVVEARCRAALQEHSDWLVGQITREVGLALENELAAWVRDAIRDEAAPRPREATFRDE